MSNYNPVGAFGTVRVYTDGGTIVSAGTASVVVNKST